MTTVQWTNSKEDGIECARNRERATGQRHYVVYCRRVRLWKATNTKPTTGAGYDADGTTLYFTQGEMS